MRYFVLILFVGMIMGVHAQEEEFQTILGSKEVGGYGSLSIGYSQIDSLNALNISARGGVVLGHSFALGLAGSGFVTEYRLDPVLDKHASLVGGYGGMFFEFIVMGNWPVHVSVPVVAGIGGVAYTTWENEGTGNVERENYTQEASTFLVLEPGIELELNIAKFFRVAGYFAYRYTTDLDLITGLSGSAMELVDPKALNSYSAGIIFKFGKF